MKKLLLFIFFYSLYNILFAQGILRNTGASIIISNSAALVYISNGGFLNESNGTYHGTIDNDGTIKLSDDWTNNATDAANYVFKNFNANGTVSFIGTSTQTISGANTTYFENLTVNNTFNAGNAVSLSLSPVVKQVLTLTDGVVGTGSNFIIVRNSAAAAITGYTGTSFINGNLKRWFASNTDTYGLPLGNGTATTNYFLAEIKNNSLTGVDSIESHFASKPGTDAHLNVTEAGATTYASVSAAGVWYITPNADSTGGAYDLFLYTANVNTVTPLTDNQFAVLKRITSSVTDGTDWVCAPCGIGTPGLNANGGSGRMVADGFALRKGMGIGTTFGQFAIGLMTFALPVSLVSFDGICNDNSVTIDWSTSSEKNADYFSISKSYNLTEWTAIAQLKAAGNSNQLLSYSYLDSDKKQESAYYALSQTDFDGVTKNLDTMRVSCINNSFSSSDITIKLNENTLELSYKSEQSEPFTVSLFDDLGRLLIKKNETVFSGNNTILINCKSLSNGVYMLVFANDSKIITKKININ